MFKPQITLIILLSLCSCQAFAFEYGNPTNQEQAHLEAINRARAAPLAEASRLNIDLFEGVPLGEISAQPVQPLSFNVSLTETARAHSQDILIRNFFEHNNPDGQTPFDRILAGGYIYRSAGENIAIIGSTGFLDYQQTTLQLHDNLFVDTDYPDRGHRVNILVPDFREIGVGLAYGDWLQDGTTFNAEVVTTNFGLRQDALPILLGVVYDDADDSMSYDAGEGSEAISIQTLQTNASTATAAAGGYGMELTEGDYLVTFTHETLGSLAKPVHIEQKNVKVDMLLSEFTQPTAISQCATYIKNQLLVPCVVAGDKSFVANLNLSAPVQTTFTLDHIQDYNLNTTEQCANYNGQTNVLHFPCLTVNEQSYWVDFELINETPITIRLTHFGKANQEK